MTISISISAILREIYAISALRSHRRQREAGMPPLLTRDNEAALRPVIADALTFIMMPVARHIADCNLVDPEPPEIVTIEFKGNNFSGAMAKLCRRSIEHAAVNRTLALIWGDTDPELAENFEESACKSVALLEDTLRTCDPAHASRIVAHRW